MLCAGWNYAGTSFQHLRNSAKNQLVLSFRLIFKAAISDEKELGKESNKVQESHFKTLNWLPIPAFKCSILYRLAVILMLAEAELLAARCLDDKYPN